ncbi:zinc finger, CCHC-type containing protein [Tanacetum coccineum]
MSDNIPFKIQTEIIKRVSDVKSLIGLRSVSKQWKSLIDSSQFIAGYGARKTQPHSLFLRYQITKILGFRKNYELVLEIQQFGTSDSTVEVYEPWSRNVIKSPICGQRNSFFITSYKETLLLLDHLDSSVYYDDCKVLVLQSDMMSL